MMRILLVCLVIQHPVASAMSVAWTAALLWLGVGPGWLALAPLAVMIVLSIAVPRWIREAAAAREAERAEAELEWMQAQALLNALALHSALSARTLAERG